MKGAVKPTRKRRGKRDLFAELSEGIDALAEARRGKRTLRTHSMKSKPVPTVTSKTPKAFANFSPGLEHKRQPWDC